MREFEPTRPNGFTQGNPNTTTLVIENIPSEVGYEIVTQAISDGETLNRDEIIQKYNRRMSDDQKYVVIDGSELDNFLSYVAFQTLKSYLEKPEIMICEREIEDFPSTETKKEEEIDEEQKDEYGRTPYVRRIIEEVKEEMRQAHVDRENARESLDIPTTHHR